MDLEDHEKIFADIPNEIPLTDVDGRWAARDVKYNVLDRRVIVTFNNGDNLPSRIEKLKKIADTEIGELLDNKIKKVNDNFYVGKLSSGWHENIRWGVPDYYIEERTNNGLVQKRILIRYVLTT